MPVAPFRTFFPTALVVPATHIPHPAPLAQPPAAALPAKDAEIPLVILIPLSLMMMVVYMLILPAVWLYVSGKLRREEIQEQKRQAGARMAA
jgi:hypothetical protein